MKNLFFICIFIFCLRLEAHPNSTAFVLEFANQRQHGHFFFSGNNQEHLSSECFISEAILTRSKLTDQSGYCIFKFKYGNNSEKIRIRVNYHDLNLIQTKIISDLENYINDLKENHPPNFFQRVFLFREKDYELLDHFLFLMKKDDFRYQVLVKAVFDFELSPQFMSKTITKDLLDIFYTHLSDHEI